MIGGYSRQPAFPMHKDLCDRVNASPSQIGPGSRSFMLLPCDHDVNTGALLRVLDALGSR